MNNEVSSYSIQHGDTEAFVYSEFFLRVSPHLLRGMPHRSFRWGAGRCVLNEEKTYLFLQNPLKVDRVNSYPGLRKKCAVSF